MYRLIATDDRGAAITDWVALTAGVIVLGMVVVYGVLGNSRQLLLNTFDALDVEFGSTAADVSSLGQSIDIDK